MAPELYKYNGILVDELDINYDSLFSKCDMWSLGCVLYEVYMQEPAFTYGGSKEDYFRLKNAISIANYEALDDFYRPEIKDLVTKLLNPDSTQRPTAKDILEMELIKNSEITDWNLELPTGETVEGIGSQSLISTVKKHLG